MPNPKILVFAGSTRTDSLNPKLARLAAAALRDAGADATLIDLRDFPMPLYDGDLEDRSGLPEAAKCFNRLLVEHDGFVISTPEYNSSLPAVLKNALDWASCSEADDESALRPAAWGACARWPRCAQCCSTSACTCCRTR